MSKTSKPIGLLPIRRCPWLRFIRQGEPALGGFIQTRVAEQAGYSVATLASHYAGVIRELRNVPKVPAAEPIWAARNEVAARDA